MLPMRHDDVHAQHQRVDQLASRGARAPRPAPAAPRRDRTGGMDDGLQVRVVEVEGVRGDAVDQRRARPCRPCRSARGCSPGARAAACARRASAASADSCRAAPMAQPTQLRKVRCASCSTASLQPREGWVATNFARIWVTGGAFASAATWVLRAMESLYREGKQDERADYNWSATVKAVGADAEGAAQRPTGAHNRKAPLNGRPGRITGRRRSTADRGA